METLLDRTFDGLFVLLGGGVTLLATIYADYRNRKRATRVVARGLIRKCMFASNENLSIKREFDGMIERVAETPEEIWRAALSLVGPTRRDQRIDVSELELLSSVGEESFFNEVSELFSAHIILIAAVEHYSKIRDNLTEELAPHTVFRVENGDVFGDTRFDRNAHPELYGKTLVCGHAAIQLRGSIDRSAEHARATITKLNRIVLANSKSWGSPPLLEI